MALLCFQWIRAIDVEETFDSNVGVNEFLFVLYFQISLPCTIGDSREQFFSAISKTLCYSYMYINQMSVWNLPLQSNRYEIVCET